MTQKQQIAALKQYAKGLFGIEQTGYKFVDEVSNLALDLRWIALNYQKYPTLPYDARAKAVLDNAVIAIVGIDAVRVRDLKDRAQTLRQAGRRTNALLETQDRLIDKMANAEVERMAAKNSKKPAKKRSK